MTFALDNNLLIEYIVREINPIIGEIIYDPCVGDCSVLSTVIKYMNMKHENNINWNHFSNTIWGTDNNDLNINYALNVLYLLTGKESNLIYSEDTTYDNGVLFNSTIMNINKINLVDKYDIIISNPIYFGTSYYIENAMDLLKDHGRCVICVSDDFLYSMNHDDIKMRKRLIEHFNVEKIVYVKPSFHIIFFSNRGKTSNIYFYNIVCDSIESTSPYNFSEIFDSILDYNYIKKNNYILFNDIDLPELILDQFDIDNIRLSHHSIIGLNTIKQQFRVNPFYVNKELTYMGKKTILETIAKELMIDIYIPIPENDTNKRKAELDINDSITKKNKS